MLLENAIENNDIIFEKISNIMGAIAGDIIGSVYEFEGIKNKDLPFFIDGCRFTDDTVMTCAILKALLDCKGKYKNLSKFAIKNMQEIGKKYQNAGYGSSFNNWLYEERPKPYNSYGNGSGMRVSPVAYFAKDINEVKMLSKKVTEVTHNHIEGIKGAEATAVATYLALQKKSKDEIKKYIEDNYYSLNFNDDDLFKNYRFNETSQETVPQSIYAFLITNSYEEAIKKTISWGGDTDTMGAITGAIAGAFYGVPKAIAQKAISYLTEYLKQVLINFTNIYKNGYENLV